MGKRFSPFPARPVATSAFDTTTTTTTTTPTSPPSRMTATLAGSTRHSRNETALLDLVSLGWWGPGGTGTGSCGTGAVLRSWCRQQQEDQEEREDEGAAENEKGDGEDDANLDEDIDPQKMLKQLVLVCSNTSTS